jgi:hypothetical protein
MRRALLLLALSLCAAEAQAQELGRLFLTPDQRATLDARRKARVPDKPAAAVVISPTTRLDGYVQRSGGPDTVWVNGEALTEQTSETAPRIESPGAGGRVSLGVGESGRRVRLKPGQTLDRGNGEVRDVIGDGEINVRRKPQ